MCNSCKKREHVFRVDHHPKEIEVEHFVDPAEKGYEVYGSNK